LTTAATSEWIGKAANTTPAQSAGTKRRMTPKASKNTSTLASAYSAREWLW
jgi:hypothetical protein